MEQQRALVTLLLLLVLTSLIVPLVKLLLSAIFQFLEWTLQDWLPFFASFLPSVFVLSVVFVANFGTRQIQNAPPLRYIEREFNLFKKRVGIQWPSDWTASNTKILKLELKSASDRDTTRVKVTYSSEELRTTLLWEEDELQVVFPARRAGEYMFQLWVDGGEARGSPWTRHVLPGLPHPPACRLLGPWAPASGRGVVCTAGNSSTAYLQIRDAFDNIVECSRSDCGDVKLEVGRPGQAEVSPALSKILLSCYFPANAVGPLPLRILYRGHQISSLQFLVLSQSTFNAVALSLSEISKLGWNNYYEAGLTRLAGEQLVKPKTVYIFLKEKQLIIKEYYLKIIPHRLVSYKVNPQVNLRLVNDHLRISQNDLCDNDTYLVGPNILCLAAAYYMILAQRLGGRETFPEKRELFYTSLERHHAERFHKHVRIPLIISRDHIFESTFRATRYFLESDWARLFDIRFEGEAGLDHGGVRREWMDLVTRFIFDPRNQLFVPLEEERLTVQPNPHPPPHVKLKHFRLAGKLVGKCLYESAMGPTYRFNLNARLAKSFLTQIIGIDVHYSLLATDAPDLWQNKIRYILENDITAMELTFTQEVDLPSGRTTVELLPGGAYKAVTEVNKRQYVHRLAKYLMVDRIAKQLEAFMEGVHTLVPESLLTLWDEEDLELLLCGTRSYSVEDLRKHHTLVGSAVGRFGVILNWFWQALSHMSTEDMARFLQFCTGSSLLPPGGWSELSPLLQISWGAAPRGSLPTAHTCFNLLVLPDAESYQQLERVLLTAVREGSEGFLVM